MADADMLEHADRDDAIERSGDVAVVHEPKLRVLPLSAIECSLLRAGVLLLRERDAGHVGAGNLGEIKSKTAPAAADIEHIRTGLDQQLRREVPLLGELRVVERLIRTLEIGAAYCKSASRKCL
jgi:hypothetical protein